MRKTGRTTKHIETQKPIKRQNQTKKRKPANIFKQMEHVKKNMSKDRGQQKHRCTMMLEKTRMIKHREKGQTYTKNKNNKLQNKHTLTTELKQQMDLKNANKDLSTNIASNTLKKRKKQRKHEQTHTHRTERNNTVKHTHTENQKLRGKHAHTHKKQQRINLFIPHMHKNNSKLKHTST